MEIRVLRVLVVEGVRAQRCFVWAASKARYLFV